MYLNRLLLFFLLFMFGCSSDKEQPEVINPIELYPSSAILGFSSFEDQITITNGNEGYKIFYPKKICGYPSIGSTPREDGWYEYDFPKEKIRVSIVDNIIYFHFHFEGDYSKEEDFIFAYFLLTDSKDQKALIFLRSDYLGGVLRFDRETELQLLNDPDYWQK